MDDIPSHDIGDLVDQLKNAEKYLKKPEKAEEEFNLDPEELEKFILNNAGKLVKKSIDMVDEVKQYVETAPESRDVSSLSELINASSSAIETLSKILVQNKKDKTQKEVKQMDIDGKKQLMQGEFNAKVMLSRDDVMKELFAKVEREEKDITPTQSQEL
jgi:sugar-specific transcriptional regulator TrmB